MMSKSIATAVMALFACAGIAAEQKDDPNYYKPAAYKMAKVAKVTVTTASKRNDYDPKEDCTTFIVKPKHATFFFNHSKPISEAVRMHESDFSSCEADGKVTFANGDQADWTIKKNGIAYMEILNGKSKGQVVILHCLKCEDWEM